MPPEHDQAHGRPRRPRGDHAPVRASARHDRQHARAHPPGRGPAVIVEEQELQAWAFCEALISTPGRRGRKRCEGYAMAPARVTRTVTTRVLGDFAAGSDETAIDSALRDMPSHSSEHLRL